MNNSSYFLVDSKVLPSVFEGVILAKELLANGRAQNASQAAKMAGISRSAFYKYKDYVFKYSESNQKTLTLLAKLSDKAGMLSSLTTALYEYGANILTVNQAIPVDGAAAVTVTIKTDKITVSVDEMLKSIRGIEGVISIKSMNGGQK
ncbi:MAG: ACT domain-containing protein [Ruminococcaceae bacterium]|nr:ACT domain-containing protein [Oscillospiraceae bacterium]